MLPLLIPALGGGAVVLTANLLPESEAQKQEPIAVPFPNVDPGIWVDFVSVFVNPKVNGVTDHFRVGTFEMTIRRLCDLGVMKGLQSVRRKGKPGVQWNANWVPPLSLRAFCADRMSQYRLFVESMRRFGAEAQLTAAVGTVIDDTTATLSGLLGVAHRGGLPGLLSWISSPKERAEFERTTDTYRRTNGLF